MCNRCVAEFDHHCDWINNDIGLMNYAGFLRMLILLLIVQIFQLIICACAISLSSEGDQGGVILADRTIKVLGWINVAVSVIVLLFDI